ncbi:hypothetical protein [Vibrio vulnificus]|uniref:hypothetical protein n=1 Tax=Vibrio vulnificus TaxID=672 RepID=UPI001FB02139|nr:hypothetical protein [Vibrio vulnificus]MCJ0805500.1 hypothetical protein [Vibrio vulnificus]
MSFPIILASLSLVFVGLIFGFNIQIDNSVLTALSNLGSLVGGLGAAVAAYFSYRSIGQWRHQEQYVLLYQHFNELELLLNQYTINVRRFITKIDELKPWEIFSIASTSGENIFNNYNLIYQKICELLPEENLSKIEKLNLNQLSSNLCFHIMEYSKALNKYKLFAINNEEKINGESQCEIDKLDQLMCEVLRLYNEIELMLKVPHDNLKQLRSSI